MARSNFPPFFFLGLHPRIFKGKGVSAQTFWLILPLFFPFGDRFPRALNRGYWKRRLPLCCHCYDLGWGGIVSTVLSIALAECMLSCRRAYLFDFICTTATAKITFGGQGGATQNLE